MEVIDEEGRLFGVVNVIDALVVLFVLAVLVAGIAFVTSSGETEPATRYATIDLGSQPSYVVDRISAGDTATFPDRSSNLTVTDVYAVPGRGADTASAVVRARITGRLVNRTTRDAAIFTVGDEPLRPGRQLTISTPEYVASGTVTTVASSGQSLDVTETDVTLETTVSAETASAINTGDTMHVADRTIATVESVRVYPTADPTRRRLTLGVTLETTTQNGQLTFGRHPVRVGTTIPVSTDAYSLNGTVLTRGALTPPGTAGTTTARIELESVSPAVANSLRVGMTETTRGETLARITDKRVENATVILTSESGEIFAREHPRKKDVTLTVALTTRQTASGLQFHGRALRTDTRVVLDLGSVTVRGTVIELQG